MCGFFAKINSLNKKIDFNKIKKLCDNHLDRRGPDYNNQINLKNNNFNLYFSHYRLSILDLDERSNQPFLDSSSNLLTIFNGEIYNYIELREELINLGYKFRTKSDTEVLLKSWFHWGEKCLDKFIGMFSFAIYDKKNDQIILVRDRYGIKPLYWYLNNNELVFSSSCKVIAQLFSAKVNLNYCLRGIKYKIFENNSEESHYEKINNFIPGGIIYFDLKDKNIKLKKKKWYDLQFNVKKKISHINKLSLSHVYEEVFNLLYDSIKLQLRSDVPVTTTLSSGLDSSSILALANKIKQNNINPFIFGDKNNKNTEGPDTEKLLNVLAIKGNFYSLNNLNSVEAKSLFDDTIKAQEAPFSGFSILAQNFLYKKIYKNKFKVVLSGQGADEIFAGYRKYFFYKLRETYNENKFLNLINDLISLMLVFTSELKHFNIYYQNSLRYMNKSKNFNLIDENNIEYDINLNSEPEFYNRQILDIKDTSLPTLLRYEDRNSMFHSIETRLPYTDHRIVEYALALPTYLKIQNGYSKWILRKIMDNEVPRFVTKKRSKIGFNVFEKNFVDALKKILSVNVLENKNYIKSFLEIKKNFKNRLDNSNNEDDLDEIIFFNWLISFK